VKFLYIVNKDKASNYKPYNMNKNLSKIELSYEPLELLINDSYTKYPKKYLFENSKHEPVSQKLVKDCFWGRRKTVDIMRSSFIT
jgi:hypothetical protein